jgi:hypothetical protein
MHMGAHLAVSRTACSRAAEVVCITAERWTQRRKHKKRARGGGIAAATNGGTQSMITRSSTRKLGMCARGEKSRRVQPRCSRLTSLRLLLHGAYHCAVCDISNRAAETRTCSTAPAGIGIALCSASSAEEHEFTCRGAHSVTRPARTVRRTVSGAHVASRGFPSICRCTPRSRAPRPHRAPHRTITSGSAVHRCRS